MTDLRNVETLLEDAIALLEANGYPFAAESLRDNLRGIRGAPTAGARRRRVFQLRDLCEGLEPALDVFFRSSGDGGVVRLPRTEAERRDRERYRVTLEAIQTILASGPAEEPAGTGWSPAMSGAA